MSHSILLVEDSFALRLSLRTLLQAEGYRVTAVASAEEAQLSLEADPPQLVLLDWNLPGESGLSLLQRHPSGARAWAVIMLTARDDLVKPFANAELLARVRVQLRSCSTAAGSTRRLTDCEVDLERGLVLRGGASLGLTTKEAQLLRYLDQHQGEELDRETLLREVWGYRGGLPSRTVDSTVARLRSKIEADPAQPDHLLTVHGVGYRFWLQRR